MFLAFCACISLPACSNSSTSAPSPSSTRAGLPSAPLAMTSWSVHGERLSVLVRNRGTQVVRRARALITVRDAHGNAVTTASATCCPISALAPGHTSRLYLDLGAAAQRARTVEVRYLDVVLTDAAHTAVPTSTAPTTSATPPAARPPIVTVTDVSLQTGGNATTVSAVFTLQNSRAAAVVGRAVLVDRNGATIAVWTGRPTCLTRDTAHTERLRLGRRVPAGSVVTSVTASVTATHC